MLNCRGFLIDTIRAISDMFDPSELTVTTLEKENQKKLPFLVDHIWQKTVLEPAIPLRSFRELLASLSLVLTGGFRNSSDSTSGKNQEKQQADLAALILEYERIRLPGQSDGFLASLSSKEKQLIQTMGDSGSAHQFVQDMTWTSMCRKVFRTSKGHTGLGPRIMRKGDVCVVLLGAVYPMVLRKSDQDFQLIGPALMYGFMDGEASILERQGRLQAHDFQII
jgi:hypothetical protein